MNNDKGLMERGKNNFKILTQKHVLISDFNKAFDLMIINIHITFDGDMYFEYKRGISFL